MNFAPKNSGFEQDSVDDVIAETMDVEDHAGETWTEEQIILLAKLIREDGLTNAQAAAKMGRTEPSIVSVSSRYRVRDPNAKLRKCMPCKRPFFSWGIENRICGRCKTTEEYRCAS